MLDAREENEKLLELAADYASVFDVDQPDADAVMTDLGNLFGFVGKPLYRPGEKNAGDNAVYRAGQNSVLQHILFMLNLNRGKSDAK